MMRTSNPALQGQVFDALPYYGENTMTVQGTVNRTGLLLGLVVLSASWTWNIAMNEGNFGPYMMVGLIGGLIAAIVTVFAKRWAAFTAPVYAVLEGLALGGISAVFQKQYPGIVIQAVFLTFGTLAAMLVAYTSRIIRPTENFKLGVFAATGGIAVFYLISMALSFFHVSMPLVYGNGLFGIGFSVFVVIIAALNLVLDFDFIETGAAQGAPKYMEWYGAFALMVTLIWLYLEMLRLLAKLQSRR